ncbi:DUF86 domain-containing protein [Olivibacter ginsenosidimutans]|uniref:DUF86 domain-containing protein n=1 Tax=Olivibacter ginsenosidimutans TaxID=1176537 RepID=A0ABP9C3J6_9SPHI
MSVSNIELLKHIFDELSFIRDAVARQDKDSFIQDPILSRAIIRSLEIIGEASNKLEPDFRLQYPHIEWRKIISTRNRLIHDYFGVDYDIVWDIITNKLPDLYFYIEEIINEK